MKLFFFFPLAHLLKSALRAFRPKSPDFPSRESTGRSHYRKVKLGVTGPTRGQTEGNPASNHTGSPPPSVCLPGRAPCCRQVMRTNNLPSAQTKYLSGPTHHYKVKSWCTNFDVCLRGSCWAWEQRLSFSSVMTRFLEELSCELLTPKSNAALPTITDKNHLMKDVAATL